MNAAQIVVYIKLYTDAFQIDQSHLPIGENLLMHWNQRIVKNACRCVLVQMIVEEENWAVGKLFHVPHH